MKIIKIGAMWCPGCLITNNALKDIENEYKIEVIHLDYDFDEEEVEKYNVGEILPVLIFMDEDKEIDRIIGEKNYKEIKEVLDKYEKN